MSRLDGQFEAVKAPLIAPMAVSANGQSIAVQLRSQLKSGMGEAFLHEALLVAREMTETYPMEAGRRRLKSA